MRSRRSGAGGTTFASRASAPPVPDALSLIRTFNSETNPSRPIRPSPLTASTIHGMPLDMLDRIRNFPLFLSAPESFLAAIGKHLRPQLHSPHDYILTEGDDAKAMYWLMSGAVAVTSRDGESTYAELKPGAFFGEIGILMEMPRTATIVARTRCLLVVLKKEDLVKELPNFPEVERTIRDEASERLSILQRKKREKSGPSKNEPPTSTSRGDKKRARDGEEGDIVMPDAHGIHTNGILSNKKRKSPSPGLVEAAASSALGDGLVNVRQLLKELPLFSGLPQDILHFLGLNAQPRTYPPFTDIIQQNSQGREVFFIVQGEVEVIDENAPSQNLRPLSNGMRKNMKRGSQVKARLRSGQYFGEVVSLYLAPRRTATVRSVSSVECLMITGDVLEHFWSRCPPKLKQQIESTARQRLQTSESKEDVVMTDAGDTTPPIDELVIGDRPTKSVRKKSNPKVSLTRARTETPHKPTRIEDHSIIQPADPDPFLNADLDNIRSRSRRGSLAPPPPDAAQQNNNTENQERRPSPPGFTNHANPIAKLPRPPPPPDIHMKSKRHKTIVKRSSSFSQGPLPDHLLIIMFSFFELHELMRLRQVSSHWARVLKETPELLHTLDLARYNRIVTDKVLIDSICPFVGTRPRIIDISNCFHITDEGFTHLSTTCAANVISWRMKSVWDITAQAVLEMANKAKNLEEVDFSNCRKVSDNLLGRVIGWVVPQPSPPSSGHGNFHGRKGAARAVGAPVPSAPPPGTVFGCPKLKKLTLSYCKHVTDRSMAHMAFHAASRLEQIDLTRCTTITDQGFQHWGQFQFSRLTKLCLADCTYLTDNAIVYLTNAAKGLRDLDLSFCCALSDTATEVLALGCPHLRRLNLSFCGSAVSDSSLRSIGLHLLELRELSVRGCVRVTGIGVEAIVEGCHKLKAFDVSQCKNLNQWLESGGIARFSPRVKFETVAGGRLR
ncbi:MAG: hypothetical protein L6R41_002024 [Letrouitia leprolyta]|nr:MAG: hypothetical protein L6R41_002024 [Letrouitia leprolyta]